MIPVSIEGVRRNFGISSVFMYTVTLIDESGQRIFNVGLERHEALPIVAALHNLPLPRPQTINVMADTLKFHGIMLEEEGPSGLFVGISLLAFVKLGNLRSTHYAFSGPAAPLGERGSEDTSRSGRGFAPCTPFLRGSQWKYPHNLQKQLETRP